MMCWHFWGVNELLGVESRKPLEIHVWIAYSNVFLDSSSHQAISLSARYWWSEGDSNCFGCYFSYFSDSTPWRICWCRCFFVISGYLISTIIFRSLEKESFSFLDFYARRIRRIFPALAFLLLGVILLGSLFLTPEEFKNLGKQTIYGSAFGENIFLIRHSGGYSSTSSVFLLPTQR